MLDAISSSPPSYQLWHHTNLGAYAVRVRHRTVTGVCALPDLTGDFDPTSLTYDDRPSALYRFRRNPILTAVGLQRRLRAG